MVSKTWTLGAGDKMRFYSASTSGLRMVVGELGGFQSQENIIDKATEKAFFHDKNDFNNSDLST